MLFVPPECAPECRIQDSFLSSAFSFRYLTKWTTMNDRSVTLSSDDHSRPGGRYIYTYPSAFLRPAAYLARIILQHTGTMLYAVDRARIHLLRETVGWCNRCHQGVGLGWLVRWWRGLLVHRR